MKKRLIKDYDELLPLVNELGILPLFPGVIPNFSLWEYTRKKPWFTDDEETDPWFWRQRSAQEGELAYGKFFNGKAGFISLKLFPDFVNFRRGGLEFDAMFRKSPLPIETAAIMKQFSYTEEYLTSELKKVTGIKKQFDPRITLLQHKTFLVTSNFVQKRSKAGKDYGWAISVVTRPETWFGKRRTLSRFSVAPETSYATILNHCAEILPKISETTLRKFLI